jgi:phosphohistidine phosphatase SixA
VDSPDELPDFELYLLRHAHAGSAANWDGPDAERPLSPKGRRQAQQLGAFLAERAFAPDAIVSSPKLRARQTAQVVADAIGIAVTIDERLGRPLELDDVADLVARAGGTSIVLVGHDPDFSELCAAFAGAQYLPMKKGAMARIDLAVPIAAGNGVLRWMVTPDLLTDRS